jgi:cytidylate kinase
MKNKIITINGSLGSGKSSTADLLAKELDYQRFSSGDFMRNIARNKGISLNELSKLAENDKTIDTLVDNEVKKAELGNEMIIDSRLAFHWIPNSFKVYLELSPEIAKERILHNLKENKLRQESEEAVNSDEVYKKIIERLQSEKKRYWELYKIDHTDKQNFDLVIDTKQNNLSKVVSMIIKEYKKWLKES